MREFVVQGFLVPFTLWVRVCVGGIAWDGVRGVITSLCTESSLILPFSIFLSGRVVGIFVSGGVEVLPSSYKYFEWT